VLIFLIISFWKTDTHLKKPTNEIICSGKQLRNEVLSEFPNKARTILEKMEIGSLLRSGHQ